MSIAILGGGAALSQGFKKKTLNLDGKNYAFEVRTTADDKPYGYFDPGTQWIAEPDGSTVVYVCWENYRVDFKKEHQLVQMPRPARGNNILESNFAVGCLAKREAAEFELISQT